MTTGGDRLTRPFVDDIVNANQDAADCLQPMGQTSENVGADFDISREQQDKYAAESYRRAEEAQKAGWFDDEIAPITVRSKSQSANTSIGLLPPSSSVTGISFSAAALDTMRPTSTDPVNVTLRTFGCATNGAPHSGP